TVTEASDPSTWQRWGVSRADDTGNNDNSNNLNNELVDANGNAVSLKVRQKAGTTDQWEIYMPAGSMIKPNLFNGDRLQANKNDFLTRWPFVVDGAWN
ncbi:hypothetical protein ABXW34_19040, partial [Streptococcus suis]